MKYKNLILTVLIVFMTSGCSLIPRITMDTPNTLPQSVAKSKVKFKCSGRIDYYEDGTVKSCTKGYSAYSQGYNKQERKMTIVERIKGFINGLIGWGFWGFVLLAFLCPSLIGLIAGRILEATGGVAKATLTAVSRAVQSVRKNGKDLNTELESELDKNQKDYIAYLKDKEKIK